jgi:hypothetical protein
VAQKVLDRDDAEALEGAFLRCGKAEMLLKSVVRLHASMIPREIKRADSHSTPIIC